MWRDINEFCFEIIGDYMCISGISHLELDQKLNFMFPPLTKTGSYDRNKLRETILEAKKIFESKGAGGASGQEIPRQEELYKFF